jgi:hypothetical protein
MEALINYLLQLGQLYLKMDCSVYHQINTFEKRKWAFDECFGYLEERFGNVKM